MGLHIHKNHLLPMPFLSISEPAIEVGVNHPTCIESSKAKILYFLGGEALLKIDADPPVPVRSGSIAILPKPCVQTYLNATGKASLIHAYGLRFLPPAKRKRSGSRGGRYYDRILNALFATFDETKIITDGFTARLHQQLLLLRHEFEENDHTSPVMLFAIALSLTAETSRLLKMTSNPASSPGRRKARSLVNAAQEYMVRNLRNHLTLEQIARDLNVSEEHLCRTFRREAGRTPREVLRQLQIDAAKNLLVNSQLEIQKISDQTGFSSPNMFCRFFRKHSDVTPTEYRHNHRGHFRAPWKPVKSDGRPG